MTTALVSKAFIQQFGQALTAQAKSAGQTVEFMTLPEAPGARLAPSEYEKINCIFLDRDIRFNEQLNDAFSEALLNMSQLQWIHYTSSGIGQQLHIKTLNARGVLTTSSTGSNAQPVAQTGLTGLLMLARGFTTYVKSQQKHEWSPLRGNTLPEDLMGQTLVIIGLGAVGKTLAGYARALGLKVIGVRRSPLTPSDPVDEMFHPSNLLQVLPRADWVVIACPLTPQTENMIEAKAFGSMKRGVRLINIGRGEVVNEASLIEHLKNGHLAGAALDAHCQEPLPADSPLWDLPNVIITPHNASASQGNEQRCADMFVKNFGHWVRKEPMFNLQSV